MTEIDEAWVARAVDAYDPPDLTANVAPGMVELLDALAARPDEFRLSLVTGNLEEIAHRKLAAAGIGHYFEPGQGGFGSDDEDRGKLPGIARARASDPPWPRERTIVIGDTPRDIECARVDAVRVAAVATGHFSVDAAGGSGRRRRRRPLPAARAYGLGPAVGVTTLADPPPRRFGSATALKCLPLNSMPVRAPISSPAGAR